MKSYPLILLFIVSLFVFSCKDSITDVGSGIQPTSDQIKIGTDTFHLGSETVPVDFVTSIPDSFLLGNYFNAKFDYNTKFGSTNAEILAQVNCPVGFKFPPLSVGDSAQIVLLYSTWFGDKNSPMDINIYEMNKSTFAYSSLYPSNLDPTVYTDQSVKLAERIFSPKDVVNQRADSFAIIFKLNPDFVHRFFDDTNYSSTSKFLNFFKGVYIKANFGSGSLL